MHPTQAQNKAIWRCILKGLLLGGVDVHRIRFPKQKGEMRMATLSVLKFGDPYGADRVLVALQGMQDGR